MAFGRITPQAGASSAFSLNDIDRHLRSMSSRAQSSESESKTNDSSFYTLLQDGMREINTTIKASEQASVDMASGKSVNLHETMLAVTKAELAFNLAVQMRNKMVEAYQEVMRMQV